MIPDQRAHEAGNRIRGGVRRLRRRLDGGEGHVDQAVARGRRLDEDRCRQHGQRLFGQVARSCRRHDSSRGTRPQRDTANCRGGGINRRTDGDAAKGGGESGGATQKPAAAPATPSPVDSVVEASERRLAKVFTAMEPKQAAKVLQGTWKRPTCRWNFWICRTETGGVDHGRASHPNALRH